VVLGGPTSPSLPACVLEIVALIAFSKNYFALMAITTYVLAALLFGPAAPTLCPLSQMQFEIIFKEMISS